MQAPASRSELGRLFFVVGISVFAFSGSFSISLTEGGLLLAWLGLLVGLRPGRPKAVITMDYLVILLLAWELLTALMSHHRGISVRAYRSEWLVLTYFLVSLGMESTARLSRVLRILAVAAGVAGVYGICQHFTGLDFIKHKTVYTWHGTYKALGLLGHHITFGVFYSWVFSISLAFLVFVRRGLRSRILWTVLASVCALAVLYSYSRAAWIGSVASFAVIGVIRRFRLGYLVLIVVAVLIIAVAFEPGAVRRAAGVAGSDPISKGDATRVLLLRTSLRMIAANPVFGIGPGTFTVQFDDFKVPGDYSTTCHPHNDYVSFAVHSGIIGLAILIGVLANALACGIRLYRKAADPVARACLLALVAGMTAIVVSGLFQCNLTDSEIGVQAWLIVGAIGMFVRNRGRLEM